MIMDYYIKSQQYTVMSHEIIFTVWRSQPHMSHWDRRKIWKPKTYSSDHLKISHIWKMSTARTGDLTTSQFKIKSPLPHRGSTWRPVQAVHIHHSRSAPPSGRAITWNSATTRWRRGMTSMPMSRISIYSIPLC